MSEREEEEKFQRLNDELFVVIETGHHGGLLQQIISGRDVAAYHLNRKECRIFTFPGMEELFEAAVGIKTEDKWI